jgi:predicted nucleotidyltransferase
MQHNYLDITKNIVLQHVANNNFKVFLFGSRACGNEKKMSDIDIGLLGNEKFPVQLKFAIEEAINESIVPFKVDLIDFYNVDENFKAEALKKIVEWK